MSTMSNEGSSSSIPTCMTVHQMEEKTVLLENLNALGIDGIIGLMNALKGLVPETQFEEDHHYCPTFPHHLVAKVNIRSRSSRRAFPSALVVRAISSSRPR